MSRPARTTLTQPFFRAYVLRGVGLWTLVRIAMAFAMSGGAIPPTPTAKILAAPYVAGIVLLAAWGDARVRREDLLLGNAGISPLRGPVVSGVVALVLEVVVLAVTGVLG